MMSAEAERTPQPVPQPVPTPLAATAWAQWQALNDAWAATERGPRALATLAHLAHGHSDALWAALPTRYRPVLLGLLDRLEAGALFTEESCSYSPRDLQDHVSAWLGHAQDHLQRMPQNGAAKP